MHPVYTLYVVYIIENLVYEQIKGNGKLSKKQDSINIIAQIFLCWINAENTSNWLHFYFQGGCSQYSVAVLWKLFIATTAYYIQIRASSNGCINRILQYITVYFFGLQLDSRWQFWSYNFKFITWKE